LKKLARFCYFEKRNCWVQCACFSIEAQQRPGYDFCCCSSRTDFGMYFRSGDDSKPTSL